MSMFQVDILAMASKTNEEKSVPNAQPVSSGSSKQFGLHATPALTHSAPTSLTL